MMSMDYHSKIVTSNQDGIHPDLEKRVRRYMENPYTRPVAEHTLSAFQSIEKQVAADGRSLILDAGCGVGESSIKLAEQHPQCLVIGIDQSEHRLSKNPHYPESNADNLLLLRADCVDFWRLALDAEWTLEKHYILYPNPWPKKKHLLRRWHAHPVFPDVLRLGGVLELRSNWPLYLQEFSMALEIMGYDEAKIEALTLQDEFLTPFERKYVSSGQIVYRLCADLPL